MSADAVWSNELLMSSIGTSPTVLSSAAMSGPPPDSASTFCGAGASFSQRRPKVALGPGTAVRSAQPSIAPQPEISRLSASDCRMRSPPIAPMRFWPSASSPDCRSSRSPRRFRSAPTTGSSRRPADRTPRARRRDGGREGPGAAFGLRAKGAAGTISFSASLPRRRRRANRKDPPCHEASTVSSPAMSAACRARTTFST